MYLHFFSKNISVYAIFNDQSNDMLTNNIISFEQLGPGLFIQVAELFPGDRIQLMTVQHFIAQSLSLSPFHCLDMTEIMLKET